MTLNNRMKVIGAETEFRREQFAWNCRSPAWKANRLCIGSCLGPVRWSDC